MAKPRRQCGTMIAYQSLWEAHRGLRQKMHALEHATEQKMMFALAGPPKLVTIPVVVHVVYTQEAENISDAQIKSQLAVLNRDFRALTRTRARCRRPGRGW